MHKNRRTCITKVSFARSFISPPVFLDVRLISNISISESSTPSFLFCQIEILTPDFENEEGQKA